MERQTADLNLNSSNHQLIINSTLPLRKKPALSKLGNFFDVYKNRNLDLLYLPVSWDNYYQKIKSVSITYPQQNSFKQVTLYINQKCNKNGIVLCFHGGGQTALSYCQLSKQLRQQLIVVAYDMAGHGKSKQDYKDGCLHISYLVDEGIKICEWVLSQYPNLPIMLIGHSLGGSIAAYVAKYLLQSSKKQILKSLILIDSIEGNTLTKKQSMIFHLKQRKQSFSSQQQAIKYAQKQIYLGISGKSLTEEIQQEHQFQGNLKKWTLKMDHIQDGKLICLIPSHIGNVIQVLFKEWYKGLSKLFIDLNCHKILMTQSFFSLDEQLKQGLRQQKFLMIPFEHSGHFIHEDQFQKVGRIVLGVFNLV